MDKALLSSSPDDDHTPRRLEWLGRRLRPVSALAVVIALVMVWSVTYSPADSGLKAPVASADSAADLSREWIWKRKAESFDGMFRDRGRADDQIGPVTLSSQAR